MRKYTGKLLIGFKKLCDRPEAHIRAKTREGIGIAIINEAQVGQENLRQTVRGPWVGEIRASFNEMIDNGLIKQITPPEDTSE